MLKVSVCVGSSCHVRGSYKIIELLNKAIKENGLESKVEVSGSFCLGNCMNGVSVKVGEQVYGVNEDSFKEFFETNIKKPAMEIDN